MARSAEPTAAASGTCISVIVPVLNEQEQLTATLSHVALAPGDELIVVDGGSTDDTLAIARQFTSAVLSSAAGRARHAARLRAASREGDVLRGHDRGVVSRRLRTPPRRRRWRNRG